MTIQERDAISSPEKRLLIYDTRALNFNFFEVEWQNCSVLARNYNSIGGITTTITSSIEVANGMFIAPSFVENIKLLSVVIIIMLQ